MKSPFPGMDPYLEQYWGDVHTSFLVYTRNQLNAQLPEDLQARVEEGVRLATEEEVFRTLFPDVQVREEPGQASSQASPTPDVAVAEPYLLPLEDEPSTERFVEIVESNGGRVVTIIELLSPANKIGLDGTAAYFRRQQAYLKAGVSLVEIDLVRQGEFVLAAPEERIPSSIRTPYMICIRRATKSGRAELYPVSLRSPLPNIPIPLRRGEPDVILQLQPVLDECYRDGRYHSINYRVDPTPRLGEEDSRWADQLLREKKMR